MSEPPVIVGIGEALWDVLPSGKNLGGAPANFACHVATLIGKSSLISSLGDDNLGREAWAVLAHHGVDTAHLQIHPTRATGQVQVALDHRSVPQFHFMPEPAWDEIAETEEQLKLARSCRAVNFGTLAQQSRVSLATTRRFVEHCPPDCLRLFDMNLRGEFWSRQLILDSLAMANALKCNEDELKVLKDILNIDSDEPAIFLRKVLQDFQLKFIALTLGEAGSLIVTPTQQDWHKPTTTQAVDTTGAGDSFVAALMVGLLAGIPLPALHQHASRIASYVCTQEGATPSLPVELITPFANNGSY
jgi:fructokinase